MSKQNLPSTKDEVLEFTACARLNLEALFEDLSDEQLTWRGPDGGWSVKDHMAHLATWEAGIAALLQGQDRYQAMGITREIYEENDTTKLNAIIEWNNTGLSLSEVRDCFAQSHRDLLDAISPLTFEDLMQPYNHYEPHSDIADPVVSYVAGNTWGHWQEHSEWIRELVASL